MKTMIVADRIWHGMGFEVYPDTRDVEVLQACSNEEVLYHHQENKADLIITGLYGTGMSTEQLCSIIREAPELKTVSLIACRRDNDSDLPPCKTCRANLVLTLPIRPGVLRCAIEQLLIVPERASCHIALHARCQKPNVRGSFHCQAENISTGGMLIRTRADFNCGDRLHFTLNMPYAGSYQTQAEVIRAQRYPGNYRSYGLRFSRLEPTARHAIKMFVEQRLTIRDR